jgi:hypothetical protein
MNLYVNNGDKQDIAFQTGSIGIKTLWLWNLNKIAAA